MQQAVKGGNPLLPIVFRVRAIHELDTNPFIKGEALLQELDLFRPFVLGPFVEHADANHFGNGVGAFRFPLNQIVVRLYEGVVGWKVLGIVLLRKSGRMNHQRRALEQLERVFGNRGSLQVGRRADRWLNRMMHLKPEKIVDAKDQVDPRFFVELDQVFWTNVRAQLLHKNHVVRMKRMGAKVDLVVHLDEMGRILLEIPNVLERASSLNVMEDVQLFMEHMIIGLKKRKNCSHYFCNR
jgi:hypothetical protein